MIVEYTGGTEIRAYIHEKNKGGKTNTAEIAKQINKETGYTCEVKDDLLVVGSTTVPVDYAVVFEAGYMQTLPKDAFKDQYREVVDIDQKTIKNLLNLKDAVDANTKAINEIKNRLDNSGGESDNNAS